MTNKKIQMTRYNNNLKVLNVLIWIFGIVLSFVL